MEHKPFPPPWVPRHEEPTEPVTESPTEVVARKASQFKHWCTRLKMELLAFGLFLVGVLATVDPDLIVAVLPQRYHGWVILGTAVAVYITRRFVKGPPEPIIRGKR